MINVLGCLCVDWKIKYVEGIDSRNVKLDRLASSYVVYRRAPVERSFELAAVCQMSFVFISVWLRMRE